MAAAAAATQAYDEAMDSFGDFEEQVCKPIFVRPAPPPILAFDDDDFDYIGDGPFGECNEAAAGSPADWANFCNSLISNQDKARCHSQGGSSEQGKRNWCYSEFGE